MSETLPLLPPSKANVVTSSTKRKAKVTKRKLGTFEGVFLPTTLNVLSILMFLRFGFIVGQMGIMGALLLLVMSYTIDTLTVLSVSAISTNGTVKGGGAYYMISRSLGPEFGGAIGIIFFIGQILNASLNVVGFIEPLLVNFGKPEGDVMAILPDSYMWQLVYSTVLLAICTAVAMVGSSLVSKTAFWLFVVLTLSTLSIPLSAIFVRPHHPLPPPYDYLEYTGIAWSTIKENLWPHFTSGAAGSVQPPGVPETFKNLFGIFFPATAGIFAGASMSGELKNPSRSIPQGTLKGLLTSFILYFLVIISLGASVPRELLHKDIKIIQTVNLNGLIIIFGEVSTSLFSVIMGVVGAASMLNAIADDRIIPGLNSFAMAKKKPAEKRRAEIYSIIFTWFLAQIFLFADINEIATLITMAFLMTFLVTNLACFLLRLGSAPNFRPSFKYFSSKTAFTGGLVSVLAMYLVDGVSATSIIVFLVFLIMMIHYSTPPSRFGDISQLLIYHQVRKYLLRLKLQMSVKYWRPQILLLCDNPRTSWNLIGFCNHLKKGGLYILGHVVLLADDSDHSNSTSGFNVESFKEVQKQKNAWVKLRDMAKIKAFVQIAIGPTLPWGVRNVFLGSGLGGMKPNITVIGFYDFVKHGVDLPSLRAKHLPTDDCRKEKKVSVSQWVQIVEDLVIMQATVAVAANFRELELPVLSGSKWFPEKSVPEKEGKKYIDLYPIQMSSVCMLEDGKSALSTNFDTYTLILQLGSILSTVDEWKASGYQLRIIVFVETVTEQDEEKKRLNDLLESLRIKAEVKIICFEEGSLSTYNFLVKGYGVTSSNRKSYEDLSKILEKEEWWTNLVEARETLKSIEKQRALRKGDCGKPRPISMSDNTMRFTLGALGKSPTDPSNLGKSLQHNRRYTLSNLHEKGLSFSLNMKAQGGDGFFNYSDSGDDSNSSISDTESESNSNLTNSFGDSSNLYQSTTSAQSIESNPTTMSSIQRERSAVSILNQKPRGKIPLHPALKVKYSSNHALSSDQLSVMSSRSNLRPNFSAVKIPKSIVRDADDEDDDDDDNENEGADNGEIEDEDTKPSITFAEEPAEPTHPVSSRDNPRGQRKSGKVRNISPYSSQKAIDADTSFDIKPIVSITGPGTPSDQLSEIESSAEGEEDGATDGQGQEKHDAANVSATDHKAKYKQLKKELADLTFNDLPAKGQHIILNELMKMHSNQGETAVIFSTLPAPVIGTHLNDEDSMDYTSSLATWLDGLPPILLLNSQTVTVTTAL
ncbi:putative vacuolar cation-chloride cotransporter [Clavispora lusitaniae]|uniref:Vacuolar cation-chloride cotransporter n=1 Tax=Clavispora lusitaniae TaxID=36911 RepID=A0ACD0WFD7_CLALS|nr:hypothetical protein E0198_001990 [Clavispora lusitaniae]KAF7583845.1 Amino acid permease family protein [Clavispora lusitaniae]QFZ26190.1 putative vacuolar cation-chloride cotransporter [Clavispora lusitaniae]QFZ31858.1 putative vacuolar cation-chloride cotransporter [Clavispora lusitaniae]QFZ37527.1 putative vacuolar cation-chloride cotransporter [Clavispora lusitaniae]